jgi:hypothetical protein
MKKIIIGLEFASVFVGLIFLSYIAPQNYNLILGGVGFIGFCISVFTTGNLFIKRYQTEGDSYSKLAQFNEKIVTDIHKESSLVLEEMKKVVQDSHEKQVRHNDEMSKYVKSLAEEYKLFMAEYEEKLERMTSLNKDDLKILERLLDE